MRKVGVGAIRDTLADSLGPAPGQSLGDYLREQRRTAQLTLRQLAERAEVSNPYLSQVERGLRHPSAQVLAQIARGLRISAEALYVRAGLLDAEDADPEGPVPTAVRSDPHLQERHKRLLLELYSSFRQEAAADGPAAPESTAAPEVPAGRSQPRTRPAPPRAASPRAAQPRPAPPRPAQPRTRRPRTSTRRIA